MHVFDPSIFHDPDVVLLPLGSLDSQGDYKITVTELPARKQFGYKLSAEQYVLLANLPHFEDTSQLSVNDKGFLLSAARNHLIHVMNKQAGLAELDVFPVIRNAITLQDETAETATFFSNGVIFPLRDAGMLLLAQLQQEQSLQHAAENVMSMLNSNPEDAAELREQNPQLQSFSLERILLEEAVTMVQTLLTVKAISLEYLNPERI